VTQWIHIQSLSPENKGGFPYIPFRADYRNRGYSLSHTWSHTISFAILTSGARWPFSGLTPHDISQIQFFLSQCCTHYLPSPPCFPVIFPPLMPEPILGQRTSSWSRGLYFHSVITWPRVVSPGHILIIFDMFFPGQASTGVINTLRSIDSF
jgi:hypothetical protein